MGSFKFDKGMLLLTYEESFEIKLTPEPVYSNVLIDRCLDFGVRFTLLVRWCFITSGLVFTHSSYAGTWFWVRHVAIWA